MSEAVPEKLIEEIDSLNAEQIMQLRRLIDAKLETFHLVQSAFTPKIIGRDASVKDRSRERVVR